MAVIKSINPIYNFLRSIKKQQLEIKHVCLEKQTNTEHGEVNLQMKKACLCSVKKGVVKFN